jgi:hypothetical protein
MAITSPANLPGFAWGLEVRAQQPSHDERVVDVQHLLGAMMFHAPFPVAPEIVEAQTVFLRKVLAEESVLEACPLGGIDLALKDRILDALSEVEARFGNPS